MTFEDVAVHFSQDEWKLFNVAQKHLYCDVMMENFELINSLGKFLMPSPSTLITSVFSPWMF
jgi:hypothetical protein